MQESIQDIFLFLLMIVSVALAYFAYLGPPYGFNVYQTISSLLFWASIFLLLKNHVIKNVVSLTKKYIRTLKGITIWTVYLIAHLLLYGFILEGILVSIYGGVSLTSPSFFVSSNLVYPVSLANAILGLAYNPNVTLVIPPYFGAALTSFSFFMAIIIDMLILTNIMKTSEVGNACTIYKKSKNYMAMPLIGIIAGASCCMSLPFLIAIAVPAAATLTDSIWVYYMTYFLFPPLAAIVLKSNLDSTLKIELQLTKNTL